MKIKMRVFFYKNYIGRTAKNKLSNLIYVLDKMTNGRHSEQ